MPNRFLGQQYNNPAEIQYLGGDGSFQNHMPFPVQQVDTGAAFNNYLGNNTGFSHTNSYDAMKLGSSTPAIQGEVLKNYGLQNDYLKMQMNQMQNPSWQKEYLAPAVQGIQALSSLSGMYLGFQNLKLQKQQLGIAKDQWATTKKEMARIAGVRKNLNASYNS